MNSLWKIYLICISYNLILPSDVNRNGQYYTLKTIKIVYVHICTNYMYVCTCMCIYVCMPMHVYA